jgi:hypothetical protein
MMIPAATQRKAPPAISGVPFLPPHLRMDVITPMLGDLETATSGGRRYVMGKLLAQLGEAASAAEPCLADLRRRTIRNTLTLLAHEAERLLPDAEAFARGARVITSALTHV